MSNACFETSILFIKKKEYWLLIRIVKVNRGVVYKLLGECLAMSDRENGLITAATLSRVGC